MVDPFVVAINVTKERFSVRNCSHRLKFVVPELMSRGMQSVLT
jgi:hypothetical protein